MRCQRNSKKRRKLTEVARKYATIAVFYAYVFLGPQKNPPECGNIQTVERDNIKPLFKVYTKNTRSYFSILRAGVQVFFKTERKKQ